MNNEQVSPYCGTIIRRNNNSGNTNITFPTCNYIYIYVLFLNYYMNYFRSFASLFVNLNNTDLKDIDVSCLSSDTNNPSISYIAVRSYSNTNISINTYISIYVNNYSEYKTKYDCDIFYVCFN